MFRYLNALLAVVALGALPGLSGCLGGGGGGSTAAPAAQMPREPAPAPAPRARAEPTPEPEPAADPEPEPMIAGPAPAPRAAPTPAPPTQAPAAKPATRADLWRGVSYEEYDSGLRGDEVRRDGGGNAIFRNIQFSSGGTDETYAYQRYAYSGFTRLPGLWTPWVKTNGVNATLVEPLADKSGIRMTRSRYFRDDECRVNSCLGEDNITVFESSGGAVTDIRRDGAVFGRTVWNDGDDDNRRWSAWGWWLEYRAGDFIANAPGERENPWRETQRYGVFVDGPEFRASPASLPETGSATYRGPAMGVFASNVGAAELDSGPTQRRVSLRRPTDSLYAGEFTGSAEIAMTYPGEHGLADHVTNIRISRMDGVMTNLWTGVKAPHVRTFTASEGPAFRWEGRVFSLSNPSGHSGGEGGSYLTSSSSLEEVSGLGMVSTANTLLGNAGHSLSLAFSNVEGAGGNPRNIGGLFMVRAHQANKRDYFLGVFLAPLVTP